MDYCHLCRRHLNGALACPGCGTSIERLPAFAGETGTLPYAAVGPGGDEWAEPGGDGGDGRELTHRPAADPAGAAARPGRAGSRRDRKAAAHRRRRRRTLFVAAGFALAAGGLSLAELAVDRQGSAPRPVSAGDDPPQDGPPAEAGRATVPGVAAVLPAATGAAIRAASPAASSSWAPSDPASASPTGGTPRAEPTGTAGATAGHTTPDAPSAPSLTRPSATGAAPSSAPAPAPDPAPDPDPTSAPPTPEPSPEETCDRFLWWCT